MMKNKLIASCVAVFVATVANVQAADHNHPQVETAAAKAKTDPKPYPLSTCVVSGEKFGGAMGEPVVFTYEGREIKLCCKSCRKDFDAAPAKFVAKVDAEAKLVKPYPLKTCLISGEALGGMGKPVVFIQDRQEVKLCCKSCKKDFDKNAKEYVAQLKKASEAAAHVGHAHQH